jgi:hypothetical protein
MISVGEEQRAFDAMKPDLVRSHPGRFAVICGQRLLGVFESVDEALLASSEAFDAETLPEGAPVLITEIAERVSLRVMARPYARAGAGTGTGGGEPGGGERTTSSALDV